MISSNSPAPDRHNTAALVAGGAAYFTELIRMSDAALEVLVVQMYIIEADRTGQMVADAWVGAAKRGVQVFILADGFASRSLPNTYISYLRDNGVKFRFFLPLLSGSGFYIGRRMHHKIVIADARHCLVGGRNISDRYNDRDGQPAWLDWAVAASGPVAAQLHDIAANLWSKNEDSKNDSPIPFSTAFVGATTPTRNAQIRILRNDWISRQTDITRSYYRLLRSTTTDITLMSGYFWPSRKMTRKLIAAAKRGIKVRLILTAVSDVPLSKAAERYTYGKLLRAGIKVYEYRKNVLHGKIAVADRSVVNIGSYNINNISARASIELNLLIRDKDFAATTEDQINEIIATSCNEINASDYDLKTGVVAKLKQWLSYQLIHVIFYLFTFYFRQRNERKADSAPPHVA